MRDLYPVPMGTVLLVISEIRSHLNSPMNQTPLTQSLIHERCKVLGEIWTAIKAQLDFSQVPSEQQGSLGHHFAHLDFLFNYVEIFKGLPLGPLAVLKQRDLKVALCLLSKEVQREYE